MDYTVDPLYDVFAVKALLWFAPLQAIAFSLAKKPKQGDIRQKSFTCESNWGTQGELYEINSIRAVSRNCMSRADCYLNHVAGNRLVWLTFVFQQAPNFSVQLKLFVCSPWGGTLVLGWLAIRARSGRMLGAIVAGISSGRDCIDHLRRWFSLGENIFHCIAKDVGTQLKAIHALDFVPKQR